MGNSLVDVKVQIESEADTVDGMDFYETCNGRTKHTRYGRVDPCMETDEILGKRSAKRHQNPPEGEEVEPAKKFLVDTSFDEASSDCVNDTTTGVKQTRTFPNTSCFGMARWMQMEFQNDGKSEHTKEEPFLAFTSQVINLPSSPCDYKRNLARNPNSDKFEIDKLKERLIKSSELALGTTKDQSGAGSGSKSSQSSGNKITGNARTVFGGLPLQATLENRIFAHPYPEVGSFPWKPYRPIFLDTFNKEARQTNRHSSPPSFPASDLSSSKHSLHSLTASPAFHVDGVHPENLSLQKSRNESSLPISELHREKSFSCKDLSQLNLLTSKLSFLSPPIQKNTPSSNFFTSESPLMQPISSITSSLTLEPSTAGSSLYDNFSSVNIMTNHPSLPSHPYPEFNKSSPNNFVSTFPAGDLQQRGKHLQASPPSTTHQPPSYEGHLVVSEDDSSSSSLYSETSRDALHPSFSNQHLPAVTPLTPVTRKPRVTHPGCTTIKYNRKSNPDLEKRRTYFCDHPGHYFFLKNPCQSL